METVDNADNGTFVWDGTTLHQNDIRLYHAATKYDFQWEVADKDANGQPLRSQARRCLPAQGDADQCAHTLRHLRPHRPP